MPRVSQAQVSYDIYTEYDQYRSTWANEMGRDFNYFLNMQWEDDEVEILKERGQFPLVINRITPVILQKQAQLGEHRPTLKALPMKESANNASVIYTSIMEYVLQQSKFRLVDLAVKRNHLVKSIGYYFVYIDEYSDEGKGEVYVTNIDPDYVYVDPNSREPDFSDADHMLVVKEVTVRTAKRMFPDKIRAINAATDKHARQNRPSSKRELYTAEGVVLEGDQDYRESHSPGKVLVLERYTKERRLHYIVQNVDGKFHKTVDEKTYAAQYATDEQWTAKKVYKIQIRKIISLGTNTIVWDDYLPTEHYPIIPVPNIWVGTPYPLSDVRYLRGIQDEINKRRSLMILNAALSSSNKWLYEKGSIDEDYWTRHAALPNAKLPYRVGYNAPVPVHPLPLPSALSQLEAESKYDVEYASGVFPLSQGDSSQAPETYAATLALEEFAGRRLQPSMEMFSSAKCQLGRVIIDYAKHLYRTPKFIRILGERKAKDMELTLNEPSVNKQGDPERKNLVERDSKYDVVVESGMTMPTSRFAMAMFYKDLFKEGIVDSQAVLEKLDLEDRDEIIERVSMVNQSRRVQEVQSQQIKQLEGLTQTLRRQLIQAGIKNVVNEYRMLEKSELLDTEVQQRLIREMMQLELQAFEQKVDDAVLVETLKEQIVKLKSASKEPAKSKENK